MDIYKILYESDLPDGEITKTRKLALIPVEIRQNLIKTSEDVDEVRTCAALEIQRVFRGYCTRCRILYVVDPTASKTAIYGESKHQLARLRDVRTPSPETADGEHPTLTDIKSRHSTSTVDSNKSRLQQYYQSYVNRMVEAGSVPSSTKIMGFEDFCATYIQDWWEQVKSKEDKPYRDHITAVSTGKSKRRTPIKPKKQRSVPLNQVEAATIIQKAWRRHIDIQVYRYYRDLINFKQKGDPSMMLRCINPNEAKYLDAAMGVHVKFRLAGDRFPPNIYYKVYTHRPIQDLCANSPKDYTKADTKRLMARDVHNKGKKLTKAKKSNEKRNTEGWYERIENNGWRLVSDRLIHHVMSDPVTWDTSKKKVEFHHNKVQRKQDIERKKKEKKIEWMRKMYKDGMLKAKVNDKETVNLIEGAAAGMVATVDAHGTDAVQDWEVDELLDWTTGLNFEDYLSGWKELATSQFSEKSVEDRFHLNVTDLDPFEISISQHQRKKSNSTRQSHNTPATSNSAISVTY